MYFQKIDHPYNFVPLPAGDRQKTYTVEDLGSDIFHVTVRSPRWDTHASLVDAKDPTGDASRYSAFFDEEGGVTILDPKGKKVLTPYDGLPFGVQRKKWLWCFSLDSTMRFYGMGEKNIGFEKSGIRTKFWNTDIWADFSDYDIAYGQTDPMYLSAATLLIHIGTFWLGVIVPSPYPVFMDTGARQVIEGVSETEQDHKFFYLGAAGSAPELYLFPGNDPLQIVGAMQQTAGVTPRPPLWSLGYHQSRWGYASIKDIHSLDKHFTEYDIPCDGLWLDIDYMDGYRIFSIKEDSFKDLKLQLAELKRRGRRVVPILDPGIKVDHDYPSCREGLQEDIFCKTGEGTPFVGFVWPGASYFPDFSLARARAWWAKKTARLAENGFDGFWIDMNDPSTGSSELENMLFSGGRASHESYHNAYGRGMMQATYEGLTACRPNLRPFVLSRSGCIGSSRYGAVWTGDNLSNYHHLRKNVEMILSLSLSGIPFAGSDIGGFGGNAEEQNFIDWYKCCYLFPFMRNHSADGTRNQEPWAFGPEVLAIVRTCISARYTLLPYLYQLFIEEERTGHPIIRPMLLHYPEDERFSKNAEQFMIGGSLLQAPNLWGAAEEKGIREVLIPEGAWVDLYDGAWTFGKETMTIDTSGDRLHLFMRAGAIIPLTFEPVTGGSTESIDLSASTMLIAPDVHSGKERSSSFLYHMDDGKSFAYLAGDEDEVAISYTVVNDTIAIDLKTIKQKTGRTYRFRFAILGDVQHVVVQGTAIKTSLEGIPVPGFHAEVLMSASVTCPI